MIQTLKSRHAANVRAAQGVQDGEEVQQVDDAVSGAGLDVHLRATALVEVVGEAVDYTEQVEQVDGAVAGVSPY